MSRKVFTTGEVLAAADVNSFLMDQTVMSFAGTAARGSAIPSPTTGMYTHLEDTPQRLQFWNGSAWVSPLGETLLRTTSFTGQVTVAFDNIFTSEFRNYKVIINAQSSGATSIIAQMRLAGSTVGSSTYNYQVFDASSTTLFAARVSGSAFYSITASRSARLGLSETLIGNPALATNTTFLSAGYYSDISINHLYGENTNATSYDGIAISAQAGTFTGTISIYGLRS